MKVSFKEVTGLKPGMGPAVWAMVEPMMVQAVRKHSDPAVIDGDIEFHKNSLIAMIDGGYHTVRYIQVDDGVFPIACSQGVEEHWYSIGGLMNCSFEPPCTPEQFRRALAHVPALGDLHIHPRMFADCTTLPLDDCSGVFKLPMTFDQYVEQAPKKVRGEWRRIMRKADENGIRIERRPASQIIEIARQLMPGYKAYWADKHDGYSDETAIMEATLNTFAAAESTHWKGFVIYHGDKPVAVNLAWRKRDMVYDTICIRDTSDELRPFSIGILAVLYNIQLAILMQPFIGRRLTYSLAGGDQAYKKQFCYDAQPAVYLPCISEIDLYQGATPGYYYGEWITESTAPKLESWQIDNLLSLYPFLEE